MTDETVFSKVSFADDAQARGGWNIAAVAEAFGGTTFEVEVGGTVVADNLSYSQQIAAGDYAGWGFDLESGGGCKNSSASKQPPDRGTMWHKWDAESGRGISISDDALPQNRLDTIFGVT